MELEPNPERRLKYADFIDLGVWIVRTATVIPDNERWLHKPKAAADLETAMPWSVDHAASDDDIESTLKRLDHGEQ